MAGSANGSPSNAGLVSTNTGISVSDIESQCGICQIAVGDDSIGCDNCPRWFHPTQVCTGLKPEVLRMIAAGDNEGIFYKCSVCRYVSSPTRSNSPTVSSGELPAQDSHTTAQLFEMLKALAVCVTNLTTQVTALVSNAPQQNPDRAFIRDSNTNALYAELWEFEDRKKRRDSLIVKGTGSTNIQEFNAALEISLKL